MSQRIYQSTKAVFLTAYLRVNGVKTLIKFTGGQRTPKKICGKFSTSNPDLQKAIESSAEYGRNWTRVQPPHGVIEEEKVIPVKKEYVPTQEVVDELPESHMVAEQPEEEENPSITVGGIINAQQARNYLMANYSGLKFNALMSKAAIMEEAKRRNVTFPDWQYKE